ncbi:hypothetical protein KIN20_008410 [Parelaphostrongylus tenuis]|uniref:Nematode cuticle collagen N-terminal domain-containing protein n=1 Tax=Parelaphostrongylus tenuis TaxID=148309 RepID=A0AAD5M6U4_PARTN|nr:hypothetical protein KIN20_008410 [Parelaphostrongylus tenuis]
MILTEISNIHAELDAEIESWKMEADVLWNDMNKYGRIRRQAYGYASPPTRASFAGPQRPKAFGAQAFSGHAKRPSHHGGGAGSQSSSNNKNGNVFPLNDGAPSIEPSENCNCNLENTCPAGPPGPKGAPGFEGSDGIPGIPGIDGKDAEDAKALTQQYDGCFNCPAGPLDFPVLQ